MSTVMNASYLNRMVATISAFHPELASEEVGAAIRREYRKIMVGGA